MRQNRKGTSPFAYVSSEACLSKTSASAQDKSLFIPFNKLKDVALLSKSLSIHKWYLDSLHLATVDGFVFAVSASKLWGLRMDNAVPSTGSDALCLIVYMLCAVVYGMILSLPFFAPATPTIRSSKTCRWRIRPADPSDKHFLGSGGYSMDQIYFKMTVRSFFFWLPLILG